MNGKIPVPALTKQSSVSQNNDKKQIEGGRNTELAVNYMWVLKTLQLKNIEIFIFTNIHFHRYPFLEISNYVFTLTMHVSSVLI